MLRLKEEGNKIGTSLELQYQKHKEDADDDGDSHDTVVQSRHQPTTVNPKEKRTLTASKPQYQRPVEEDDTDSNDTLRIQSRHQPTVKRNEKTLIKPPMSESSASQSLLSTFRLKPASSDPPFLMISSDGPAADYQSDMFGLYKRTWEKSEGRSVYIQEHNSEYGDNSGKLISVQGVWRITSCSTVWLRATSPSESPTSAKWEFEVDKNKATWLEDPALTVTRLNEKPLLECDVTVSLSEDVKGGIKGYNRGGYNVGCIVEPEVEGVYRPDGSYSRGRPVLQHSGGRFSLSVKSYDGVGCWVLSSCLRFYWSHPENDYLRSQTAPIHCPGDPRAARNERLELTQWEYAKWPRCQWYQSSGITVICKTHSL